MFSADQLNQETMDRLVQQKELYVRTLRSTSMELEGKIRELSILRQLGQLFERSTSMEDLVLHAVPMFLKCSEAENASIFLYSQKNDELTLLAASSKDQPRVAYYGRHGYPEKMFSMGQGFAGGCLHCGAALVSNNADADPHYASKPNRVEIGSIAAIPLFVREEPLGVVNISHPAAGRFNDGRMAVWTILASYLAIAISNALLFKELQESNRRLEKEVRKRTQSLEKTNSALTNAKEEIARHNSEFKTRVTARTGELESALKQSKEQQCRLEEANRIKDEFLNNINHELKTPLNAIIGYAGLLLKETQTKLSAEQKADMEIIEANGKYLQQILENIFSLKDIENGDIELDMAETDLNELIRNAASSVVPLASPKGIDVVFEKKQLPALMADATMLRRILFNLLDNAIKFSSRGTVTVKAGTAEINPEDPGLKTESKTGKPYVVVEVKDQGKGIREEDAERIFQKFQQADPSPSKSEGGSGLGLAIAKKLIELHGGKIWVSSRPGTGSVFGFCLPLKR